MPKRKCVFNQNLQIKYPFIKKSKTDSDSDVRCNKCNVEFNIAHGGGSDIEQHLKSNKHKSSDFNAASSSKITTFLTSTTPTDLKVAAAEGVWAFHTVKENYSFRSNDCTSKIIQTCFEPKYRCARTKCEAIVKNIFHPFAMNELKLQLEECNSFTLLTDASNHGSMKLFPVLVRFFSPYEGIKIKVLDLQSLPNETSDTVSKYLLEILNSNNLQCKIAAFSGDNTNTNFGGSSRRGLNNIFAKLKANIGKNLIGIGCNAHIVHNTIKTASDCLPIDVECIISKIFSFFYIYTVRTEALKEFCEFAEIEYKKILGYSNTRWLSLQPAIERILKMFNGLKSYFLSQNRCPKIIKDFFENESSLMWLHFLNSQAQLFHETVLKIEGDKVSVFEIMVAMLNLKKQLLARKENLFLPLNAKVEIDKFENENIKIDFKKYVLNFYDTCCEYIDQWTGQFEDLKIMEWCSLKSKISWAEVQQTIKFVAENNFFDLSDDGNLFSEFTLLNEYVTDSKIEQWNSKKCTAEERWVEIFTYLKKNSLQHKKIAQIVEYILCLPGTNASVERVFSTINKIWIPEKTQLSVDTLKSLVVIRHNITMNCLEFYNFLKSRPDILKKILSTEKY